MKYWEWTTFLIGGGIGIALGATMLLTHSSVNLFGE